MIRTYQIIDRATGCIVAIGTGEYAIQAYESVRPSLGKAFNSYAFEEITPRSTRQTTADMARRGKRRTA